MNVRTAVSSRLCGLLALLGALLFAPSCQPNERLLLVNVPAWPAGATKLRLGVTNPGGTTQTVEVAAGSSQVGLYVPVGQEGPLHLDAAYRDDGDCRYGRGRVDVEIEEHRGGTQASQAVPVGVLERRAGRHGVLAVGNCGCERRAHGVEPPLAVLVGKRQAARHARHVFRRTGFCSTTACLRGSGSVARSTRSPSTSATARSSGTSRYCSMKVSLCAGRL